MTPLSLIDSAVSMTQRSSSHTRISQRENTSAYDEGAQTGWDHEKNRGYKSRDTVPLKINLTDIGALTSETNIWFARPA